jgi:four helix bundle protein
VAQLNGNNPVQAPWYPLHAQGVAVRAAGVVLPHLRSVPAAYRRLADQATWAVTSVALNTAEGSGRAGRARNNHFRIAYGSALEASAALEILVAVRGVPEPAAAEALALLDRTRAMPWGLMHAR